MQVPPGESLLAGRTSWPLWLAVAWIVGGVAALLSIWLSPHHARKAKFVWTAIVIVPYQRRKRVEGMLRGARINAEWIAVPSAAEIRAKDRERLLEAVNGLREEERLVIACRYFLELSEEETAAALGVRLGTVKSRTSRALEHLRESYA